SLMRLEHGDGERPIRSAISWLLRAPFCWSRSRILRSYASSFRAGFWGIQNCASWQKLGRLLRDSGRLGNSICSSPRMRGSGPQKKVSDTFFWTIGAWHPCRERRRLTPFLGGGAVGNCENFASIEDFLLDK